MPDVRQFDCVLITGASSGLGEEFAIQLASRARQLVLVARREALMETLAERIRSEAPHIQITVLAADLADSSERLRLVNALSAAGLVPDLLVNNAGLGDYGDFATSEWQRIEAMLRVNMEALTHLTHAMLPGMIRNGGAASEIQATRDSTAAIARPQVRLRMGNISCDLSLIHI